MRENSSPLPVAQRGMRLRWLLLAVCGLAGAYLCVVGLCFQRAKDQLSRNSPAEATRWLQRLDLVWPRSAEVQLLMARACRRQGRLDDVRTSLTKALRYGADKQRVDREETLAMAQAGQLSEVESQLARLLSEPGDDAPEICEAFVNGFLLNYRFSDAYRLLSVWQQDYPESPQPLSVRGQIEEQLGNYKSAAEEYSKALELDSERDDIRLRLLIALTALHSYDRAAAEYSRLRSGIAHNTELQLAWAKCLMETGRQAESRVELQRILSAHPQHREARLLLARQYLAQNEAAAALPLIENYVAQHLKDYDFRYLLSQVLVAMGKQESARPHLEFVARADAELAKAKSAMDHARQHPNDSEARFEIGQALMNVGFLAEGSTWLRSVLELEPHHAGAHEALAKYYLEAGLPHLASRHTSHLPGRQRVP